MQKAGPLKQANNIHTYTALLVEDPFNQIMVDVRREATKSGYDLARNGLPDAQLSLRG